MLLALPLLAGCDEFRYEGFQKPFRFELFQDIPIVYLKLGDGQTFRAGVDTASPLMIFDRRRDGSKEKTNLRLLEPVECLGDGDCAADTAKPRCDRATGRCVPVTAVCTIDSECLGKDPTRPVCDNGACAASATECTINSDCKSARRPNCSGGKCVLFNPRFIFHNLEHYDLPLQSVGLDQSRTLGGLVGAPLLRNFVVRFSYWPLPTLTFLDEIPDSNEELADDCGHGDLINGDGTKLAGCTAVLGTPLHGGGLLQAGEEVTDLPATRLVVDLCMMPDKFDPKKATAGVAPERQTHGAVKTSGVDVQAVVATGMGVTVISASLLDRLKPLLGSLPAQVPRTLHLPYGTEKVTMVSIPRTALVSNETRTLGPCGELALRRRLMVAAVAGQTAEDGSLLADKKINGAGFALLDQDLSFAVVEESSRLIQGLRKELRSSVANIDMVLGGSLLKKLEMEVDYPASRTILRCAAGTAGKGCLVTPFCAHPNNSNRTEIQCPQPPGS